MMTNFLQRRRRGRSSTSAEVTSDPPVTDETPAPTEQRATVAAVVAALARWGLRLLIIAAAAVGAFYVLGQLWVVVLPALLALLLTTVLWPATRLLRRRMPASAAALATLVAGLVPLVGIGVAMGALVSAEADQLGDAVVEGLEDLQDWTTGPPLNLDDNDLGGLIDRATDELQDRAQEVAGWTLSGVNTVGSLLVTLVLTLVLTFFFLKDGPRFLPWVAKWLPERGAAHAAELSNRFWSVLGGFIRAQAGVGLADAIGIGVGLALLGVPLALPLAVLTFVGAFIPIVGAFLTGILAVLVAWVTEGTTTALLVAALVIVVQQLESNLLSPLLMGRTLALHPAMVILAVTAGGTIWGIAGAFLSVPALAVGTAAARYGKELVDAEATSRRAPAEEPLPD